MRGDAGKPAEPAHGLCCCTLPDDENDIRLSHAQEASRRAVRRVQEAIDERSRLRPGLHRLSRHPTECYQNIKAADWNTPTPLKVGSQIAFVARFLGRLLAYTYEVTELSQEGDS